MIGVKMSRSPATEAASEAQDISGNESSGSSDDAPLSELLRRNSRTKSDKDRSDVSSDDEPLITRKSAAAKKLTKNDSTPPRNSTNSTNKNSDKNADEPSPEPPKEPAETKQEEPAENHAESDDEPLSELAKKLYPQRKRKATVFLSAQKPVKSKRKSAKKAVTYTEVSSDDSDDEPLVTFLKTNPPKEKKSPAKGKTTKQKENPPKDSNSEDEVPLKELVPKKKPVKRNTKKKAVSPGRASRKRRGGQDDSSDNEPLINLKGKQTKSKAKTPSPRKSNRTPKKTKKTPVSGQSSNSSDDEALIKAAKHPQVTKIPKVILERCDG